MLFGCGQGKLLRVFHGDDVGILFVFHLHGGRRFGLRVSLAVSATSKRGAQANEAEEAKVKTLFRFPHRMLYCLSQFRRCPPGRPGALGYAPLPGENRMVRWSVGTAS